MEHLDLKVVTTGNSLAIIIPKEGRDRLNLSAGDLVRVRFQKMKLVPLEEEEKRRVPLGGRKPVAFRAFASLNPKVSGGARRAIA